MFSLVVKTVELCQNCCHWNSLVGQLLGNAAASSLCLRPGPSFFVLQVEDRRRINDRFRITNNTGAVKSRDAFNFSRWIPTSVPFQKCKMSQQILQKDNAKLWIIQHDILWEQNVSVLLQGKGKPTLTVAQCNLKLKENIHFRQLLKMYLFLCLVALARNVCEESVGGVLLNECFFLLMCCNTIVYCEIMWHEN